MCRSATSGKHMQMNSAVGGSAGISGAPFNPLRSLDTGFLVLSPSIILFARRSKQPL